MTTTQTMNNFAEVAITLDRSASVPTTSARTVRSHRADLFLFGLVAAVALFALASACLHPAASASFDATAIVTGL